MMNYPKSVEELVSLFENPNTENLESSVLKRLRTMNPKELAIYMADNQKCNKGLKMVVNYVREQDEIFRTKFKTYLKYPLFLDFSDETEERILNSQD